MALGRQKRNQRSSPRIDVLLHVKGELIPVGASIRIVNLNRTGAAVLSEVMFRAGDRVDFRMTTRTGLAVQVTAAAVHTEPRAGSAGLYMTGFRFEPGLAGVVPEEAIVELLETVRPAGFKT